MWHCKCVYYICVEELKAGSYYDLSDVIIISDVPDFSPGAGSSSVRPLLAKSGSD